MLLDGFKPRAAFSLVIDHEGRLLVVRGALHGREELQEHQNDHSHCLPLARIRSDFVASQESKNAKNRPQKEGGVRKAN